MRGMLPNFSVAQGPDCRSGVFLLEHVLSRGLLLVLGGVLVAAWAFTAARSYTLPNIMELVVGLGQPVANANETLEKTATIAAGSQVVVIWAGRGVVILATVMALLGAWRSWRVRGLRVTAILLMVLPGMLVLMTGFGGEVPAARIVSPAQGAHGRIEIVLATAHRLIVEGPFDAGSLARLLSVLARP